jgi:hypothetical protein
VLGIFILFIIAENLAVYQFIISEFDLLFFLPFRTQRKDEQKEKEREEETRNTS